MLDEYEELLRRARHLEIDIDTLNRRLHDHLNQKMCDGALKSIRKVIDNLQSISINAEKERPEWPATSTGHGSPNNRR